MAKYATLKAAVQAAIKTNGEQQITGQVLQTQLVNMITSLGKYFQSFGGLATPAGSFTAGDESVTFLAVEAGTYTNFGGAVLDGKTLHVLAYDGDWADVDTLIPSGAAFEAALALAIKGAQSGIAEGIADTISAGTAQEFLQRQSGGDGVNCIKRIKGCTKAINQLAVAFTDTGKWTAGGGIATRTEKSISVECNSDYSGPHLVGISLLASHKYLIQFVASNNGSRSAACEIGGGVNSPLSISAGASKIVKSVIITSIDSTYIRWYYGASPYGTISLENFSITDLTLAGFANYTLEQILALYPNGFGAYNPGVLKSNDAAALLTDGRNQWDEQWLTGYYQQDGTFISANNRICSKNWVPVFPNTTYFLKSPVALTFFFYDADKNFIEGSAVNITANTEFTTPANARWCLWYCTYTDYGATYANDICLNLSDASFNGTYEPYWQRVLALRISELTGIPEGGTEADRVTIAPSGLRGLGTSYDEIAGGKATIRRGVRAYESGDESDASVITDGTNTDYALATPIVYTDLQYADGTPFTMPATILVDNYGTERIQAPEGATTPSAPFCCDSNYSIGVANLVKRLAALENAE